MIQSLAEHFGLDEITFREIPKSEYVHCIIDTQAEFCDPNYVTRRGNVSTIEVCDKINKVAQAFRDASLYTFMIYAADYPGQPMTEAAGGLYRVDMSETDIPVAKREDSPFGCTNITTLFDQAAAKTLILSGFNEIACVKETAMHARDRGYNVWILSDCVGNGNWNRRKNIPYHRKEMHDKGILFMSSDEALAKVQASKHADTNSKPSGL